jgi:hypothetical protein
VGDLYVTGGKQRDDIFVASEEWHSTDTALLFRLSPETGRITERREYLTPPDACPEVNPGITFKAASVQGNKLYVCTCTEVMVFELPDFKRVAYVSLPCFNDVHHVMPTTYGTVIVAVTGLDMVVEITPEGEILREWSVIGEDTWSRFSRNIDYRRVATTKPHRAHPNFAFQVGEEIWVTRCDLKDAICLTRPGKRIDIAVSFPHDGHVFQDKVWFTTVDGHVVIADPNSTQVVRVIDLNKIDNPEGHVLGWCRGLLPLSDSLVWVAFSRLRKTKFKEKINWAVGSKLRRPSRIALYDIAAGRCLREIELSSRGMDLVFSVLPCPEEPVESSVDEIPVEVNSFGHDTY